MERQLTEQESFWGGRFGDEYIERNGTECVPPDAMWADILRKAPGATSFLELGANIGRNLHAIHRLCPGTHLTGLEINSKAAEILHASGIADVIQASILDFIPERTWDMVFTSLVLIHINPDFLPKAYEILHKASARYILIAEYYNPTPVEVIYRGNRDRLFKRDFAGELLDRYSDLQMVDYRFIWHRDRFAADDLTWFLLEKKCI